MMETKMLSLALIGLSFGGVQPVLAASSAQAVIDWSSLSVQLIDYSGGTNVPVLIWTSGDGYAYADVYSYTNVNDHQHQDQSVYDVSTPLLASVDSSGNQATASRDASGLKAEATNQNAVNGSANASVSNYGTFELTGHGAALIALDWSVSTLSDAGNYDWGNYASANVNINGYYSSAHTNGNAHSGFTTYTYFDGPRSENSTFFMAVFNPGNSYTWGSISANASASVNSGYGSPVVAPLPTSVWLFGSALFGFLWRSKHKNQAIA